MRLVTIATLSWLVAGALHAAEIRGEVRLVGRGGADPRDAVVWFEPAGAPARPPASDTVDLRTRGKDFDPHVLAVPVGTTVRFPNDDPILHNVFSVSPGNEFDLGLYGPDETRAHRFDESGVVRVFCNVHHSMAAYVVVLDTPLWTRPAVDGSFRLDGVPDGGGLLVVWHERAEPWTTRLEATRAEPFDVEMRLTRPRVPRHLDKDNRPYRTRRERYD